MDRPAKAFEILPGLLGIPLGGSEKRSAYAFVGGGEGLLADPGSARDTEAILAALAPTGALAAIRAILLCDPGPEAASGVTKLRDAGFRGEILVREGARRAAEAYDFALPLRAIGDGGGDFELPSGRSFRLFCSDLPGPYGSLLALDRATGTLVCGDRFAAREKGDRGGAEGESAFLGSLAEHARSGAIKGLAHRDSRFLDAGIAEFLERSDVSEYSAEGSVQCEDRAKSSAEELEAVEKSLSMDPLSGLKNQRFLHSLLLDRFRAHEGRAAAALHFVVLDGLLDINRELGRSGGDEALRSVAYAIGNEAAAIAGAVAVKMNAPVFVLLEPDADRARAAATAERMRKAIRESEVFRRRLTVSIGLVFADETHGTGDEAIRRIERTGGLRAALAAERGGDTVCESSTELDAERHFAKRVVLIEPEAAHAAFLTARLEARGYSVAAFRDGRSALDRILSEVFDIVVSEAMVPRMSGFQVREVMMADSARARIPFVLVSSRKDEESIRKAASLKIVHYLKKPFSMAELISLVENLTRG